MERACHTEGIARTTPRAMGKKPGINQVKMAGLLMSRSNFPRAVLDLWYAFERYKIEPYLI